jgi:CheY-like chemotaxis protein
VTQADPRVRPVLRVLIVEPDPVIRDRLCTIVRTVAASADDGGVALAIDEVTDGTTALASWSERRHALVIAEIVVEGTSGLALLRRIRADEPALPGGPGATNVTLGRRGSDPTPRTAVFLVSQMSRDADRYWGLRQGATEYFGKPFADEALASALRRAWSTMPKPTPM